MVQGINSSLYNIFVSVKLLKRLIIPFPHHIQFLNFVYRILTTFFWGGGGGGGGRARGGHWAVIPLVVTEKFDKISNLKIL